MKRAILILFFPLFLTFSIVTYSHPAQDTLEMAKKLRVQGRIKEAFTLLKKYNVSHPHDLNVTWLYAQTAFWTGHISEAKKIYEGAVHENPKNYYLNLDYAKMLVDIGEYRQAKPIIVAYLHFDPSSVDANYLMGKLDYYKSDFRDASQYLGKVIVKEPENKDAGKVLHDICLARSLRIGINGGFSSDDQPLVTYTPSLEFGVYLHALSNLGFTISTPVFQSAGKTREAWLFNVANTSVFPDPHMELTLGAGIMKFPSGSKFDWTGKIGLSKRFIRHLDVSLNVDRNPYFYTLSSLDSSVIQNHASLSVSWKDSKTWTGALTFEGNSYPVDKNYTYGFNFWGFAPPLKVSVFAFRLGYGFNYSTSKEDHFVSEKTLAEILTNYDSAAKINGVYRPYYTPRDQQVHSVLLSIDIHASKSVVFGLNANYGFYAMTSAPYFYLGIDTTIVKEFAGDTFHPVEASAFIIARLSGTIQLKAEYRYRQTYFYTSNYAGFGLTINLCNDRKKK